MPSIFCRTSGVITRSLVSFCCRLSLSCAPRLASTSDSSASLSASGTLSPASTLALYASNFSDVLRRTTSSPLPACFWTPSSTAPGRRDKAVGKPTKASPPALSPPPMALPRVLIGVDWALPTDSNESVSIFLPKSGWALIIDSRRASLSSSGMSIARTVASRSPILGIGPAANGLGSGELGAVAPNSSSGSTSAMLLPYFSRNTAANAAGLTPAALALAPISRSVVTRARPSLRRVQLGLVLYLR